MSASRDNITCVTCKLIFEDTEKQYVHLKTEWHKFNVIRKINGFPPVTLEEFQAKEIKYQKKEESKNKSVRCYSCNKVFSNENSYSNHLNSKKHKKNSQTRPNEPKEKVLEENIPAEESEQDDSDVEEVDSDEWDELIENPIDNNDCMFCSYHSASFLSNLEHMTLVHSFFIPNIEYCVDIEGLLKYLGEKISKGLMCIWCNDKSKTYYTLKAVQQHMVDKSHCKMIHEGIALAEYIDFYDYSTSYPDAENANPDEEISTPELVETSEYQLVLPSGVIGHRSMLKYYRQHLNPNRATALMKGKPKKLHKDLDVYKSLGYTETQLANAARAQKDIRFQHRMQSKQHLKQGIKNNKLQKHFRSQVTMF